MCLPQILHIRHTPQHGKPRRRILDSDLIDDVSFPGQGVGGSEELLSVALALIGGKDEHLADPQALAFERVDEGI
jgi:hypothetical protein